MERDQVISFLFQACDAKDRAIEGLRQQVADLQRQLAEAKSGVLPVLEKPPA